MAAVKNDPVTIGNRVGMLDALECCKLGEVDSNLVNIKALLTMLTKGEDENKIQIGPIHRGKHDSWKKIWAK